MRLKFSIFIIVLLIQSLAMTPFCAQAKYISKDDLEAGYTISTPDNNLISVIVEPQTLRRGAFLDIAPANEYESIPKDKNLVSGVYQYSILPAQNNTLDFPVKIQMKYPEAEKNYKEIFIYNFELAKWQNLPCQIDMENNILTASTKWASGIVAVFADKINRIEYLKSEINSPTILVTDSKSGEILIERASSVSRPIASLTKLMTAAVFLDNNPGWNKKITIKKEDGAEGAALPIKSGDIITTKDLFFGMLVASANNAAKALARSTGLTSSQFREKMNQKAKDLGLSNTYFYEPTGLSQFDKSTAADFEKLVRHLFSELIFLQATTSKYYKIKTLNNGRKYTLKNTNQLLGVQFMVTGSKTGYTYEAGRCLFMRVKNSSDKEVIAIIMGAQKTGAHWSDMKKILDATLLENNSVKIVGN